ncbi:MAG: hypothetical protein HY553_10910 [Elusimicrobia bacterium]|nr:hypothetical protein [Elusimicrobiota bacterium]
MQVRGSEPDNSGRLTVAAFVVALAGGVLFVAARRRAAVPELARAGTPAAALPARPSPPLPEPDDDDPEQDRLMVKGRLPGGDMEYGEFLTLLELAAKEDNEAAKKLRDEIQRNPEAARIDEEARRRAAAGEKLGATGVLRAFRQSADFRTMVSRLAKDSAASSALWSLYERPQLAAAKDEHLKALLRSPGAPLPAPARPGAALLFTARPGGGRPGTAASPAGGGTHAAHAAGAAAGPGGAGAAGPAGTSNAWTSGPAAHDVGKLQSIGAAGPGDKKIEAFCRLYPQFCEGDPPRVRDEFRPLVENDGLIAQHGLWGACFRLGIYAACKDACVGACLPIEAWKACLDGFGQDEPACIAKCLAMPCTIPSDAWTRNCAPAAPATPPAFCAAGCPAERRESETHTCTARVGDLPGAQERRTWTFHKSCDISEAEYAALGVNAPTLQGGHVYDDASCPQCWLDRPRWGSATWKCSQRASGPEFQYFTSSFDVTYSISCSITTAQKQAMIAQGWIYQGKVRNPGPGAGEWEDVHTMSRCRP